MWFKVRRGEGRTKIGEFQICDSGSCICKPLVDAIKIVPTVAPLIPYAVVGMTSLIITAKMINFSKKRVGQFGQIVLTPTMRRRMVLGRILVLSFLWSSVSILPLYIFSIYYPSMFVQYPMLSQWLQTLSLVVFAFSPVSWYLFMVFQKQL